VIGRAWSASLDACMAIFRARHCMSVAGMTTFLLDVTDTLSSPVSDPHRKTSPLKPCQPPDAAFMTHGIAYAGTCGCEGASVRLPGGRSGRSLRGGPESVLPQRARPAGSAGACRPGHSVGRGRISI
jgi:hypothetical protein